MILVQLRIVTPEVLAQSRMLRPNIEGSPRKSERVHRILDVARPAEIARARPEHILIGPRWYRPRKWNIAPELEPMWVCELDSVRADKMDAEDLKGWLKGAWPSPRADPYRS